MKILLAAFYYPPMNNTGARRVGGTAEQLARLGHDVRVVTGCAKPSWRVTGGGPANVRTLRTPWIGPPLPREWTDPNAGETAATGRSARVASSRARVLLRAVYRTCFYLPDPYVGWLPYAVRGVVRRLDGWRPDLVLSSAYPLTSIMVGQRLARHCRVPHVVELRDLWTDNPYRPRPAWARPIDRTLERAYLSRAAGMVTVSEELARILRAKYPVPVITVYHGFEPRDAPRLREEAVDGRNGLRLVYTGSLHDGRRDPLPLLRAMSRLEREGLSITFHYYGPDSAIMRQRCELAGDPAGVRIMGVVPNESALDAQLDADVLVLLMWDHPNEVGSMTGKLFEYIGAGKPVLVVGAPHSAAARLVVSEHLGHAATSDDDLTEWLRRTAATRSAGALPAHDLATVERFSRASQIRRLCSFLEACAAGTATRIGVRGSARPERRAAQSSER